MSPANPPDSELMGYVIRMVTPLRREFGRVLDIKEFFSSRSYAAEVIDEALTSQNERLQNYATYVESKVLGPRTHSVRAAPSTDLFIANGDALIQPVNPSPAALERRNAAQPSITDQQQKEIAARYKTGLR